jgi:[glutamine synthetase] adenylyltransferase / [glutamine synthetase]-adenylyl-L-tyrosine phosphorylase
MPGRTGCGPDFAKLRQPGVKKGPDRGQMAHRADTADGKAGLGADQRGVGLAQAFAGQCGRFVGANLVATSGHKQNGGAGGLTAENDRFGDLVNLHTHRVGGLFGSAGQARHFADICRGTAGTGVFQRGAHTFQAFAHRNVLCLMLFCQSVAWRRKRCKRLDARRRGADKDGMSFASNISRAPFVYNLERGAEARALFPDVPAETCELIAGTAGCSPYLKMLMEQQQVWLRAALDLEPDQVMAPLLAEIAALDPDQVMAGLRRAKSRVALYAGLADLGGVWDLAQVTGALSDLADAAVHKAITTAVAAEVRRGKLPGMAAADISTAGGMVALAMGKMGAGELNYSSDIDLICLFDETRYAPDTYMEARTSLIRATRKMAGMLNDLTEDGYVFRTDLRLRPDPSSTPVCLSMEAAERYYESVGRTWERAAYIKARPCGGDIAAGKKFLDAMRPFVWRKHLDFAAIQDAHDMRLRIRDHKGFHGPVNLPDHNMKLGRGGIREIEFFTQTRQLIAGGRDADLRLRGTVEGLRELAAKGWVEAENAGVLIADYQAHREVEHRLQMINDAQTHSLPKTDEGFARLAAFMGQEEASLRATIKQRLERVHSLTEDFFAPGQVAAVPEMSETARKVTDRWTTYPALRSARAVEIFDRLKPDLLARVQKGDRPEEALLALDGFLAGLPAGVQLFSLFEANPQLVDLVIDICSTAPALAQYLSRHSAVFDAVIGGGFFDKWPGRAALRDELAAHLAAIRDYEAKLDFARRWGREWQFRIGVHQLRSLIAADESGAQYADLAAAVVAAMWHPVVEAFSRKYGPPPGRGAVVLGMGSLGAGRMNAASDLDLIAIYDADGVEFSEGRRPLASRVYYARLTQAFITALTAQMAQGRIYEVDMRLRPSGKSGPVATSFEAFRRYQKEEAWTWEHLALTRAQVVAGSDALGRDIEDFRRALLRAPRDAGKILADTNDMRARLAEAKPARDRWEPKQGGGRMMDIELLAQVAALLSGCASADLGDQLDAGVALGWLSKTEVTALKASYTLCWHVQSAGRLLSGERMDISTFGQRGVSFLLRETGANSVDMLAERMDTLAQAARAVTDSALTRKVNVS